MPMSAWLATTLSQTTLFRPNRSALSGLRSERAFLQSTTLVMKVTWRCRLFFIICFYHPRISCFGIFCDWQITIGCYDVRTENRPMCNMLVVARPSMHTIMPSIKSLSEFVLRTLTGDKYSIQCEITPVYLYTEYNLIHASFVCFDCVLV